MAGNVFIPQTGLNVLEQGLTGYFGGSQENKASEAAKVAAGNRGTMRSSFFDQFMRAAQKPEDTGGL
jgi:hypothetical protein